MRAQNCLTVFADEVQQSQVNEVSYNGQGSIACLRALEALVFFIAKYAFSPFWGTFCILFLK